MALDANNQNIGQQAAQNAGQQAAQNAGQQAAQNAGKAPQGRKGTYFANKRFVISYSEKKWMLILGILLLIACLKDIVDTVLSMATGHHTLGITDITSDIIGVGLGVFLLSLYLKNKRVYGRYVSLIDVTMGQIPIANIARLYPTSYAKAEQDLQAMIDKKILYGAYIDRNEGMLVLNRNNPNVEKPMGEPKKEPANSQAAPKKPEADVFMDSHHWTLNTSGGSEIGDPDIDLRVGRINATLAGIKQKVEQDKSLRKDYDLNLFLDFYIPKINTLLSQYQGIKGLNEEKKQSKLRKDLIETLGALDTASNNLWRKMVDSDVVNMSTELDALKSKLIMDGFNKSDFDKKDGGASGLN